MTGHNHMPDAIELAAIIRDAADCLHDNVENHCSWPMANAAAEAIVERLRSVPRAALASESSS